MPPMAQPGQVNYHWTDRFTLAHFLIGVGYAFFGFNFYITFFLAVFWEFIENPLKKYCHFIFPHSTADTLRNIIGDIIAVMFGWFVFNYFHVLFKF